MSARAALAGAGLVLLAAALPAAAGEPITTLDERRVAAPELEPEFRQRQESLLAEALAARAAAPDDPEAWIWVGRRQAYLGRWSAALETFSEGVARFPGDARFLRHRGHRLITLRRLDEAIIDLSRAAEITAGQPDAVEPDGLPNARGIPTSTLQTNIWYHFGLALYLHGDFAGAARAYRRCRELSTNPDMEVAASYWLYLSQRRAGEPEAAAATQAAVADGLELIENDGYYELLLLFKHGGDLGPPLAAARAERETVAFATTAYGLAAGLLLDGRVEAARALLTEILAAPQVTAFGYIAAEAEIARGL